MVDMHWVVITCRQVNYILMGLIMVLCEERDKQDQGLLNMDWQMSVTEDYEMESGEKYYFNSTRRIHWYV